MVEHGCFIDHDQGSDPLFRMPIMDFIFSLIYDNDIISRTPVFCFQKKFFLMFSVESLRNLQAQKSSGFTESVHLGMSALFV